LYFRSFEFNASVYYLLRPVGYWLTTYNQIAIIGPALALGSGLIGLALAWREQRPTLASLAPTLLLMLTAYYALATTVHPWYLTLPVGLSVLTRFRYALVWGGLAILSYAAYRTSVYAENPWLVGLEYAGMYAALGWDLAHWPKRSELDSTT
jgi:alpha-1,6-mannosyltransferase